MSKALEAYRRLCRHLDYDNDDYMFNGGYEEDNEVIENALKDYETIKKDLDTLEILKKVVNICGTRFVNIPLLFYTKTVIEFNSIVADIYQLTKQEYDLLKEWLEE